MVSELLEELPDVIEPYAEAGPACCCGGEYEKDWCGERGYGKEGMRDSGFDKDKEDEGEDAQDEENIDVWIWPADCGALVPGDIDQHEAANTRDGAEVVEALLLRILLLRPQMLLFLRRLPVVGAVVHVLDVGNGPDGGARHDEAYDSHDPVRPRPRRVFR